MKTPSTHSTVAPAVESAPLLDAERLDVYAVALQFQGLSTVLATRADSVVRDQLRRASLSCVLNIAEGAGQRSRVPKSGTSTPLRGARPWSARPSSTCCASTRCLCHGSRHGRSLLVRIVQMLTRLDQSLQ